jgi:hypothetical protein
MAGAVCGAWVKKAFQRDGRTLAVQAMAVSLPPSLAGEGEGEGEGEGSGSALVLKNSFLRAVLDVVVDSLSEAGSRPGGRVPFLLV